MREVVALHVSPGSRPSQWGQSCSRGPECLRAPECTPPPHGTADRLTLGAVPPAQDTLHAVWSPGPPAAHRCRRSPSRLRPRRRVRRWATHVIGAITGTRLHLFDHGLLRDPGDPQGMTPKTTTRARPPGSPAPPRLGSRAGRYALAAAVIGAGIVCVWLSPGVGWVLILVGAWLAADTAQRPPRPTGSRTHEHREWRRNDSHRKRVCPPERRPIGARRIGGRRPRGGRADTRVAWRRDPAKPAARRDRVGREARAISEDHHRTRGSSRLRPRRHRAA